MPISATQHRENAGYCNNRVYYLSKKNEILHRKYGNNVNATYNEAFLAKIEKVTSRYDAQIIHKNTRSLSLIKTSLLLLTASSLLRPVNAYSLADNGRTASPVVKHNKEINGDDVGRNYIQQEIFSHYTVRMDLLSPQSRDRSDRFASQNSLLCASSSGQCGKNERIGAFNFDDDNINAALFSSIIGWDVRSENNNKVLSPSVIFIPKEKNNVRSQRSTNENNTSNKNIRQSYYHGDGCNVRTKTNSGVIMAHSLRVANSYIKSPIRNIYADLEHLIIPEHKETEFEEIMAGLADGTLDVVLTIMTDGGYIVVKYLIIESVRFLADSIDGNVDCIIKDQDEIKADMLDLGLVMASTIHFEELPVHDRPSELQNVVQYQPEGTFVQESTKTNINRERFINFEHEGTHYTLKEKEPGDFVAVQTSNYESPQGERKVFFDEKNRKIHFDSTMPAGEGLEYHISPVGRDFVTILGQNHQLFYQGNQFFLVEVIKENGDKIMIPVYRESLQGKWHIELHNGQPVFDSVERKIISEMSQPVSEFHRYKAKESLNLEYYGKGVIYEVSNANDVTRYPLYDIVEIRGQFIPVRVNVIPGFGTNLEAYYLNSPELEGKLVEFARGNWHFQRPTPYQIAPELADDIALLLRSGEFYTIKLDVRTISAPDNLGIVRNIQGECYLKFDGEYIHLQKYNEQLFRIIDSEDAIFLKVENNEFSFDAAFSDSECYIKNNAISRFQRQIGISNMLPYEKNCVALTLSKVAQNNVLKIVNLLIENKIIKNPSQLQYNSVVTDVMAKLKMRRVVINKSYDLAREELKVLSDGRYFAVNSYTSTFESDKQSHAFAVIIKNKSIGIAGNNAEETLKPYNSIIQHNDIISVWGPIPKQTVLAPLSA